MTSPDRPAACRQCGKPLPPARSTGRTRQYCSGTCRSAARRGRSPKVGPDLGRSLGVHADLTSGSSKAMLDVMPNETGADAVGSAAAGGRAAARGLLGPLLSAESASPLAAIAFIQGVATETGDGMQAAVQRARAAGRTWAEVGEVLGISR